MLIAKTSGDNVDKTVNILMRFKAINLSGWTVKKEQILVENNSHVKLL